MRASGYGPLAASDMAFACYASVFLLSRLYLPVLLVFAGVDVVLAHDFLRDTVLIEQRLPLVLAMVRTRGGGLGAAARRGLLRWLLRSRAFVLDCTRLGRGLVRWSLQGDTPRPSMALGKALRADASDPCRENISSCLGVRGS